MAETRARDVARTFGQAIEQNTLTATGSLGIAGLSVYATIDDLPLSGIDAGTQALVTGTNTLYINNGVGWFKIALINNAPYFSDSGTPESTYSLSSQGIATTITLIAVDSEGLPITYSAVADSDFGGLASISQDSSVFTITPFSEDSATTSSGTVTFKATDGVNIASALSTFTLQFSVPNSSHTLLLAKASGNDGTNAITDESSNGYTLTKSGDVKRSAFSPYRDAGYSYYFDGSGDYISVSDNDGFDFGTGDFTIEAWVYPQNTTGSGIVEHRTGTTATPYLWYFTATNMYLEFYDGTSRTGNISVPINQWSHIAVSRESGTLRQYVNGIEAYSNTVTTNLTTAGGLRLMSSLDAAQYLGYATDIRIIKGTALYTAEFTPPTSRLTAVSGTTLLTCHLPYVADGSSSDHALTINGNVKVEPFTPFDNIASYSASNNGSSLYFDGSGDYLTIADTNSRVSTGSYTVEGWFYLEGLPSTRSQHAVLHTQYYPSSGEGGRYLTYVSSNDNAFTYWVGADGSTTHSNIIKTHQWYHFAAVRNGTSCTLYLNGKGETDGAVYDTSIYQENPQVGGEPNNSTYLEGYIADWHLTKGTAKYTSDFTPPTAPISNSSATTSIANVSTPNLYTAAQNRNSHALYGNVKSSTGQTKYASSSIYFDGSGDYIINNTSVDTLTTTTQPFTIEAWIYPTWNTSTPMIVCFNRASDGYNTMLFNQNYLYIGDAQYDYSTTPNLNEWSHIAVTHNSGRWNAYLNGNNVTSPSKTLAAAPSANYVGIGVDFDAANGGTPGNYFQGYMQDVRISDIVRYPFIPAKETFSAVSGTTLLTAHASSVTDGSSSGHTVTAAGNAAVSTFAPSSGMYSVSLDGSGDYLSVPTSTDFSFDGDFTLEGWFYFNAFTGHHILFDTYNSGTSGTYQLYYRSTGSSLAWYDTSSASVLLQDSRSGWMVTDKWYHIAVVRESGALTIFVDGSQVAATTGYTTNLSHSRPFVVGAQYSTSTNYVNGYTSNVRVTKGTALYSKNFTPPTAELQG